MGESTMELIYLYVYENDLFDKIEINFTDEYKISLEDEIEPRIVIEKNENYKNYGAEIYSEYIYNVSVLVGINGTGKTTLLNLMGMQDVETWANYENISYFMIYKMDDRWYLEVKEGQDEVHFLIERDGKDVNRHWQRAEYNIEDRKFIKYYDEALDFIMPSVRDEYSQMEFFYYKDNSADQTGWTRACGSELEKNEEEAQSTVRRTRVKNGIHDIYYFLTHKSELIQKVLERENDIGCVLRLNTSDKQHIQWEMYDIEEYRKTFIIQMLFNLCTEEHSVRGVDKTEKIKNELIRKNDYQLPEVSNYEFYKEELVHIYLSKYYYNRNVVRELVSLLEKLDYKYFQEIENTYLSRGRLSAEILEFCVKDKYDPKLYRILECINKLNDNLISYRLFSYQYDTMSAGEAKCIDIFSGIYQSIKKNEERLKNKNLILLLDEPDKGMHPELSRNFISILNDFSEELGDQNGCTFQYVITTHSPFLVLDVPGINVYQLEKKDGKTYVKKRNDGIMSNIVDLIKDTFFLKSTFGILSERYFKKIQEEILTLDKDISEESIRCIREKIEIINEQALKEYLNAKLESMIEKKGSREDLITYYQRKIEELRKND